MPLNNAFSRPYRPKPEEINLWIPASAGENTKSSRCSPIIFMVRSRKRMIRTLALLAASVLCREVNVHVLETSNGPSEFMALRDRALRDIQYILDRNCAWGRRRHSSTNTTRGRIPPVPPGKIPKHPAKYRCDKAHS